MSAKNNKTPSCGPKSQCGTKSPKSDKAKQSGAANDRSTQLSFRTKSKFDDYKDAIERPPGTLPRTYLLTWAEMSLAQKLPRVPCPPGSIYYTRGKLGKTLLRGRSYMMHPFHLDDPHNFYRVPLNHYEVNHDHWAQIQNIHASLEYLYGSETVLNNNDVTCTLKEFNRHRRYLEGLYNDKIFSGLQQSDELAKIERAQVRIWAREEHDAKGLGKIRAERAAAARRFLEEKLAAKRASLEERSLKESIRLDQLRQQKNSQKAEKLAASLQAKMHQEELLRQREKEQMAYRRTLLHDSTLKHMKSDAHRRQERSQQQLLKAEHLEQWFENKVYSNAQRAHKERATQEAFAQKMKEKSSRRQKKYEKHRSEIPAKNAERAKAKERTAGLVKKFFYRWLGKVRRGREEGPDAAHESIFYSSHFNSLKQGLDYLYQQSGHEKLDDVVFNIMKFKQELQRQIDLEDEEEE